MSIYVGQLSYQATEEAIREIFGEYGTVKSVYMPTDRETGNFRGFAFVEMSSEAEEEKAIATLDGAKWMERELKVNKARPRENKNSQGGGRRNNRYSSRF